MGCPLDGWGSHPPVPCPSPTRLLAVPHHAMLTVARDGDDPWDARLAAMLLRRVFASSLDDHDRGDENRDRDLDLASGAVASPTVQDGRRPPSKAETEMGAERRRFDWGEYRRCLLPSAGDLTHLGCFDRREAAALEDARMMREWERVQLAWAEAFRRHSRALPPGATEADFRWAMGVVGTRAFTLPPPPQGDDEDEDGEEPGGVRGGGGATVAALVPFIDMANHASDGDAFVQWGAGGPGRQPTLELVVRDEARARWCAVDEERVEEGDRRWREVHLSYLRHGTNADLFQTFGFVEEGSPCDALPWWATDALLPLVAPGEEECEDTRECSGGAGRGRGKVRLMRSQLLRAAGLREIVCGDSGAKGPRTSLTYVCAEEADAMGNEQAERHVVAARGLLELTQPREVGQDVAVEASNTAGVQTAEEGVETIAAPASLLISALEAALAERAPARDDLARLSDDGEEEREREEGEAAGRTSYGVPIARRTPRELAALRFRCEAKLLVHAAIHILRAYAANEKDDASGRRVKARGV